MNKDNNIVPDADLSEGYEIEPTESGFRAVNDARQWVGPERRHRVRAEADAIEDARLRTLARKAIK